MKRVLTDVQSGCKARIVDISRLDERLRRRLSDLGLMEETVVCVKHVFPFGGPVAIETNGQWIGIRRREAGNIEVEPQ